ncbi:hypothetical protein AMELA_G00244940 [Ameiurus melas]|uniref:Uncharacterized protein n=1 Tax=Ameiurus melas TaxID=219545 RepID=A0A7J5ZUI0_AMEME|nr:hypothetical protein AMELA_G00244940 [Ameiurus melas]
MQHLMSLARSRAAGLPLRPLLYAVGAAATAAGVYYFKKRGDGERTADTTLTEGPVQTQLPAVDDSLLDPGLMSEVVGVSVTQTDSDVPQVLTKPHSLPSVLLHLMTLRKSLHYGHFSYSSRS